MAWNLPGRWIEGIDVMFGDYDNNGYSEIYAFTLCEDSIFLFGNDILNQIVHDRNITSPSIALKELGERVIKTLDPESTEPLSGMDIAFCALDKENNILQYAGTKRNS
ncbi:MAG: hypothetical protein ABII90_10190 [Bacteroidota bacterium]